MHSQSITHIRPCRAFYETLKIKAWSDAIVPNFVSVGSHVPLAYGLASNVSLVQVTSNAFIAATYAKIILGFVRDWFLR